MHEWQEAHVELTLTCVWSRFSAVLQSIPPDSGCLCSRSHAACSGRTRPDTRRRTRWPDPGNAGWECPGERKREAWTHTHYSNQCVFNKLYEQNQTIQWTVVLPERRVSLNLDDVQRVKVRHKQVRLSVRCGENTQDLILRSWCEGVKCLVSEQSQRWLWVCWNDALIDINSHLTLCFHFSLQQHFNFFVMACTDESFTIRPGAWISKLNSLFDFM